MNEIVIYIYNHENNDSFQIVTLEKFMLWLNDNDDVFTYKLEQNEVIA
jgi:hypothetical protein